jgi:hypothetical protein
VLWDGAASLIALTVLASKTIVGAVRDPVTEVVVAESIDVVAE